jgi:hypothetical protein
MKVEKAGIPITDFIKVWCEHCGIRIDPHEERTGVGGTIIHIVTQNSLLPFPSPKGKRLAGRFRAGQDV